MTAPHDEPVFTRRDLLPFNGERGRRAYIAYGGVVYDVTNCPKWRTGIHESQHFPGQDLSSELPDAPHSVEVFTRPCVKRVGRFLEEG